MNITYYTINDLRKGHDETGVNGWKLSRFLCRNDAFLHYHSLPKSEVKALGIRVGEQDIDLIRCVPLIKGSKAGDDVLVTEFLSRLEGEDKRTMIGIVQEWVRLLNVNYLLEREKIVPAPAPLPNDLADKYLWPDRSDDLSSAIKGVYAGDPERGLSWMSPAEFNRRYPPKGGFFLVLLYQVDGMTESGDFIRLEVDPCAFQRLMKKTKARFQQKKR